MPHSTLLSGIHFELFFESSGDLLAITDNKGNFIKVNKIWEETMGLSSSQLEDTSILTNIHPEDLEPTLDAIRSSPGEASVRDIITRYADKNGVYRYYELKVMPFFELYYYTARDITDRIEAQNQILRQNEELKRLLAERDKLFSIIAHDLRSPFHGLLGFAEMFTHAVKESDMGIIMKSGQRLYPMVRRLYDLLENLLEWALLQRKDIHILPQNFILYKLVETVINLNEEKISEKHISVENQVSKDIMAYADPQMVSSVLRNLFYNAIKFTPREGRIIFNASILESSIEISLSDTGIGIPESIAAHLFSMEKDIKRKGTEGELSTGLGLILVKEYIEKNGGSIRFESEIKKGTTFYFTLPAAQ